MAMVLLCRRKLYVKMFLFLLPAVTPMVQNAKKVAMNPEDQHAISRWRQSNNAVSFSMYSEVSLKVNFLSITLIY